MLTTPEYLLLVLYSPPKHQILFPLKSPAPLPERGMNSAQSWGSEEPEPSPTPIRSVVTPVRPWELVSVPTLVQNPFRQRLVPVLLRAVPMQPDTMDSKVRCAYAVVSVYCA